MIDGFGSDTHLWLWVPAFAGTTTEWRGTDSNFKQPITDTPPRSRRAGARVLSATSRHLNQRAQGMPGARSARSRAWCVVNTRVSHHGHAGSPGIPRAMVLTVFFALLCPQNLAECAHG